MAIESENVSSFGNMLLSRGYQKVEAFSPILLSPVRIVVARERKRGKWVWERVKHGIWKHLLGWQ